MAAISTFVDDTVARLYLLGFILFSSLALQSVTNPYKVAILNWLETSLLMLLLLLASINNFWAGQYYGIPVSEARENVATVLLLVETVVLVLPIPWTIALIAIFKKREEKKKMKELKKEN